MLILASASPRRHELLVAAGIAHVVLPSSIVEQRREGESPRAFAMRMAEEKAFAVECDEEDIVLAADTVVCVGEEVFGKPAGDADARRMLQVLSGRDHWVHTGLYILSKSRRIRDVASTKVTFAALSQQEIENYVKSGEGQDKAGAYGIQGIASRFVSALEGCYTNVVGLPVALVYCHLKNLGVLSA